MTQGSDPPDPVEGGLPEPAELEPAPGTLALAPGGVASRADWEKAAAAALRKSGRLGGDDPDHAVWTKLARSTLDGLQISPLGTPALDEEVATNARPTSPGGRDVRVEVLGHDAEVLNREALADLAGGGRPCGCTPVPRPSSAPSFGGYFSTSRRSYSIPRANRRPSRGSSSTTSALRRPRSAPTWVRRPMHPTTTSSRWRGSPSKPVFAAWWSTHPRSTTGGPRRHRSSGGRWRPRCASSACWRRRASKRPRRPGSSSSATPHGRAVPHDRQASSRPAAVGTGAGAV